MRDPARNEREALNRYKEVLQRSLGCVTRAIWVAGSVPAERDVYFLQPSELPLRLPRSTGGYIYLWAAQRFAYEKSGRFVGEWKVRTLQYMYTVGAGPNQATDAICAWHWHPEVRDDCHLHIYQEDGILGPLNRLHVPTSRVSFEQVLTFAILDLGVQGRAGWEEVMKDSERRFGEYRTWPTTPVSRG